MARVHGPHPPPITRIPPVHKCSATRAHHLRYPQPASIRVTQCCRLGQEQDARGLVSSAHGSEEGTTSRNWVRIKPRFRSIHPGIAQLPAICQLSRISALKIQKHWTLFSCPECDLEACRAYVVPLWGKSSSHSWGIYPRPRYSLQPRDR